MNREEIAKNLLLDKTCDTCRNRTIISLNPIIKVCRFLVDENYKKGTIIKETEFTCEKWKPQ